MQPPYRSTRLTQKLGWREQSPSPHSECPKDAAQQNKVTEAESLQERSGLRPLLSASLDQQCLGHPALHSFEKGSPQSLDKGKKPKMDVGKQAP